MQQPPHTRRAAAVFTIGLIAATLTLAACDRRPSDPTTPATGTPPATSTTPMPPASGASR